MAQRTVVELIDDVDGGTAEESVVFGLDGVEYSIDLSAANAAKLREVLQPYTIGGTRVGGRKKRGGRTAAPADSKAQNQAIRDWARQQGLDVSDRGRISAHVVEKFDAAHA